MKKLLAILLLLLVTGSCEKIPIEDITPIKVVPITTEDVMLTNFEPLNQIEPVVDVRISNLAAMFALSYYDSPTCVTRESLDHVSPVRNDFYMEQGDGVVYYLAMYRPLDPYSWYEGVMFYEYQIATGLWCVWGSTLAGDAVIYYRSYFIG